LEYVIGDVVVVTGEQGDAINWKLYRRRESNPYSLAAQEV